ncbi:glutamate--tRNA ligase [Arenibaculum pallidiluteum]|uniref:glutamate--tRNA ligase n=1 Tax=Arenibaculum pallidiluteum TaxID=2812559 RepID=UPI001A96D11F|nr:glutamate--tRNA ligase [Arenibaculum pallidiluteum]
MKVRTRVAPSPTGDPHVGTAYVALMNYCFAKKHGGEFLLRIEDTDQQRSSAASEKVILEALRWLGLSWDEGPDVGGPHGPYRQSERTEIYREHVDRLIAGGHAFRCYCTAERLEQMRAEQRRRGERPRYDGHCLHLSAEEEAAERASGKPFVVRMKVPSEGVCVIDDLRRGPIEIEWATVDMQVLLKSDGMPTYHLANVVDDHLMGITHVMRGEEWISSAPKHKLLYEYFGWEMPALGHLPLLRNADRSKLSKRKNPTSILFYKRMGYLPEAMLNFLGLFGMSSAEGEEMATLDQLVSQFELDNISLGGPVFDVAKLNWLNGRYIRETMDPAALLGRVEAWALNRDYLLPITALAQTRIERLSDLGPLVSFFFSGTLNLPVERLRDNKLSELQQRQAYQLAMWQFDALPAWELPAIERVLRDTGDRIGAKFRDAVRAFYIAITGSPGSTPLFDSMALLGRDICRERLRQALQTLGGVTSSEADAWKALLKAEDEAEEG